MEGGATTQVQAQTLKFVITGTVKQTLVMSLFEMVNFQITRLVKTDQVVNECCGPNYDIRLKEMLKS